MRTYDAVHGPTPGSASSARCASSGAIARTASQSNRPAAISSALARRGVPRAEAERRAEPWRPWRAYAAVHLWASLSD